MIAYVNCIVNLLVIIVLLNPIKKSKYQDLNTKTLILVLIKKEDKYYHLLN